MISVKNVKSFCKDDISLIENYDKAIADQTQTWICHHRRETIYTSDELIEIGEYYHRPVSELIMLTRSEHAAIHKFCKSNTVNKRKNSSKNNAMYGHSVTEFMTDAEIDKWKKHISNANSGKNNAMYGHSVTEFMTQDKIDQWKKNISKASSGKNNPMYGSKYVWITNGTSNKRHTPNEPIPDGFWTGFTKSK